MKRAVQVLPCVIGAVAITSLAYAPGAFGCSCAGFPDVGTFERSDEAIVGRLLRIERLPQPDDEGGGTPVGRPADYVYRVTRSFKHPSRVEAGDRVRVRSRTGGASCGLAQRVGGKDALFLYRSRDGWASNLCLVTTRRKMRRFARRAGGRRSSAGGGCSSA